MKPFGKHRAQRKTGLDRPAKKEGKDWGPPAEGRMLRGSTGGVNGKKKGGKIDQTAVEIEENSQGDEPKAR